MTTPLSNAELRGALYPFGNAAQIVGAERVELYDVVRTLITSQKAIGKEEAYCDVGNYATDSGDSKLLDFVDTRIAQLSTEDVKGE